MKNLIHDFKGSYDYSNRDYVYELRTIRFLDRFSRYFIIAIVVGLALILRHNWPF